MIESSKTRIGVAAVDPLRLLGLRTILQDSLQMEVVEFDFQQDTIDSSVGIVLLDGIAEMDDLLDRVSRMRRQRADLKIIFLCPVLQPEQVQILIGAGAKGYLPDTASEAELRMALEVVLDGSIWAPRKVLARLIDAATDPASENRQTTKSEKLADLVTPREREVLQLLTEGRSNRQIAESLKIDEVTVKAHLGRLLRKAGASNRVELTLRALEQSGASLQKRR